MDSTALKLDAATLDSMAFTATKSPFRFRENTNLISPGSHLFFHLRNSDEKIEDLHDFELSLFDINDDYTEAFYAAIGNDDTNYHSIQFKKTYAKESQKSKNSRKIDTQTENSSTSAVSPTSKKYETINLTSFEIDLRTDTDSERAESKINQVYIEDSPTDGKSKIEGYSKLIDGEVVTSTGVVGLLWCSKESFPRLRSVGTLENFDDERY